MISPDRLSPSPQQRPDLHTLPSWRTLLNLLPTRCLVCQAWQTDPICEPCLSTWREVSPRCPRCAITLDGGRPDMCQRCEDQSPEFDRAIAALDYTAPWSPLLASLKFNDATTLARPLGDLLAQAVKPRRGRVSLVVPVPLSPQRLRERGYNQSWLLARRVADRLRLTARHDLLLRTRHTSRLMAMSAPQRDSEIKGVFSVTTQGIATLKGRHVAIVDDVMTTGATLNAAALALLAGGARSVSAWVVARTPAPQAGRADINAADPPLAMPA